MDVCADNVWLLGQGQRAVVGAAMGANLQRGNPLGDSLNKLIKNPSMGIDTFDTHAGLSGIGEGPENYGVSGRRHISVGINKGCVLPATFQDDGGQSRGTCRHDASAGGCGARK